MFAGASHFTTTLVGVESPKVGASGAPGGSSTSVSVIVTSMQSLPPLPSLAVTVTA